MERYIEYSFLFSSIPWGGPILLQSMTRMVGIHTFTKYDWNIISMLKGMDPRLGLHQGINGENQNKKNKPYSDWFPFLFTPIPEGKLIIKSLLYVLTSHANSKNSHRFEYLVTAEMKTVEQFSIWQSNQDENSLCINNDALCHLGRKDLPIRPLPVALSRFWNDHVTTFTYYSDYILHICPS